MVVSRYFLLSLKLKLKSAEEMEEKNTGAVVGEGQTKKGIRRVITKFSDKFLYKIPRQVKVVVLLILLVLLGLGGFYGYKWVRGQYRNQVVIHVDNYAITRKKRDEFIGAAAARNTTKKAAVDKLIETYQYQVLASKERITPSPSELAVAQTSLLSGEKVTDKNKYYFERLALDKVIRQKLLIRVQGDLAGAIIEVSFAQHLFPTNDPEFSKDVGNTKLIAEDRKRAESFAKDLYDRLASKKITFEQAVNESISNRSVRPAGVFSSRSHFFDRAQWKSEIPTGLLAWPGVKDELRKLQPGEVSQPTVMQVNSSLDITKPKLVDAYFGIFTVTGSNGTSQDFTKYIDSAFAKIEVKR
jgi:hypothetical protein